MGRAKRSDGVVEYRSDELLEQAFGGEPLSTVSNPSHDRAHWRRAALGLYSGRLPGMTQSAVLSYTSLLLPVDQTAQGL
jgi:hypothetical protein